MSAPGQLTGSDLALDPKRRETGPREHLEGREEERTWLRRWCCPLKSSQTLSSVPLPSSTLAFAPWPSLLLIKVKARPSLHLHSVDPGLTSLPLLFATSTSFQVLDSYFLLLQGFSSHSFSGAWYLPRLRWQKETSCILDWGGKMTYALSIVRWSGWCSSAFLFHVKV